MTHSIWRQLRTYFISGFFTILPIAVSVWFLIWVIRGIDLLVAQPLDAAMGTHVPGVGIVLAVLLTIGAGMLTSHVLGEGLLDTVEGGLQRIPVYRWVYNTVKQMTDAFSPENKTSFRSVVVIEYPRKGTYALGFATKQLSLETEGKPRTMVAVYVPTNHVYFGEIVLVPKDEVISTSLTIQQGIQCSLSAGAAIPERLGGTAA